MIFLFLDLRRFRTYKGIFVRDLFRVMRNKVCFRVWVGFGFWGYLVIVVVGFLFYFFRNIIIGSFRLRYGRRSVVFSIVSFSIL